MNRQRISKLASLLMLLLLGWQCNSTKNTASGSGPASPPNLIIILVDDMGYGDVGFNGCKDIPTPNIDRIAKNGVTFTNGYVSYAVCGPSRAGLITGRYQDRFGFSRNPLFAPNDPNMGLPLSEQTLAGALSTAGYRSAAIGKWHLGAHPSQRPLERGFTDFFGFLTGGHHYFPEKWDLEDEYAVTSQNAAYRTKLLHNEKRIEETEYLTDALSREAVKYVETYKDSPFFIYLAYHAPHTPLQATEKYLDRFDHITDKKRKTYAAMVSAVDDGVGAILDQLVTLELEENTIVVFLSDNGGPEPTNGSDNGPLRGMKSDLFEGGIHVPFAMQWKGRIPAGRRYEKPVISLDIFATIVALNPNKVQLKNPLDGVDLMPYLSGENTALPHPELFWRKYDQNIFAVRRNNEKLIVFPDSTLMFDLGVDLGEQLNIAPAASAKVGQLQEAHRQWNRLLQPPVFMGLRHNKEYDKLYPNRFERPKD